RLSFFEHDRWIARGDEPARAPYHDNHHSKTEDQHPVLAGVEVLPENRFHPVELAQDLYAADHHHRGDRDADERAHAAKHYDGEDGRGLQELKRLRVHEALTRAEERAGEPAEERTHGEGGELGVDRIDPKRAAGDLVLAQRFPRAPDGE